ncbi:MAG: DsrE family protein [Nitrospinae bacterium]|nr:DsrE family protein [Nitrospinota bacterium]
MRLVLVIHSGPESHNTNSLVKMAKAARAKGHDVTVFAMSAGVGNLARADFTALAARGVNITVCEHNRSQFKAPEGIEGVTYGSQYELAGFVADGDKVVIFE